MVVGYLPNCVCVVVVEAKSGASALNKSAWTSPSGVNEIGRCDPHAAVVREARERRRHAPVAFTLTLDRATGTRVVFRVGTTSSAE